MTAASDSSNVYSYCAVAAALGAFFASEAAKHQSMPRLMAANALVNYTIARLAEQVFPAFFKGRNSLSAFSLKQSVSILSLNATCAIATSFGLLESLASKVRRLHLFMISCSIVEKALEPLVDKVAREIFNKYSIDSLYKESATASLARFGSLGIVVICASSLGVVAAPQLLLFAQIHTLGTLLIASIKLRNSIVKAASIEFLREEVVIELQESHEKAARKARRTLFEELPHFVPD